MAVVFANEFHNWSKDNKDTLMKEALEKGLFTINNPNGGLAQIYVPVRFVIASNNGIPLLTSREANGQRFGKPLGYDQMLDKWEHIHANKDALIGEILADNGNANEKSQDQEAHGTSEELLNRIPERNILLLRPLSPEILRRVAEGRLAEIRSHLSRESGFFHNVVLTWSDDMADFVQSYDYLAENNARPIKAKVDALIEETLLRALRDGDLPAARIKPSAEIHLSLQKNADATMNLVILYSDSETDPLEVHKLIQLTAKDRPAPSISDEQIRKLSSLSTRLKQRVFGIDDIADRIADRVLAIENQRTSESEESRRVSTIVALGLSSTGKTELAKALAAEFLGDESELITFDFSQIQSLQDFKTRILGLRNGRVSIPSDFMKAYDRNNGKLLVAFDELANVKDPDVLTALYDFFREPIISTFSDGKPRKMGGVMVVVTGNAGQELYKNVPRSIPMIQQMVAMEDISKKVSLDSELQRKILERYFPAPLVTRWGKNNVFFFPPHTFKSLRQLAQLKLSKELKRLTDTKSRRGWKVVVPSVEDYSTLIDTIVEEGFSLRYQGASIDSFILEDLGESLESLLVKNFVPSGSTVVLKFDHKTPSDDPEKPGVVAFKVFVDGSRTPLDFNFKRPYTETPKIPSPEEQMITAYHEAGHSIMRQVFFAEVFKPGMISIIPGVTEIDDEWVVYTGIAQSWEVGTAHLDRDFYIHYLSIYLAGETAERLVTQGESHTAGKSNDIMRATALAQDVILRLGLSQAWGVQAIPSGTTKAEYLASLSERQKILLSAETNKLLEEARALARKYLTMNFDNALLPLGNLLIEKGIVKKEEMEAFYARVPLNRTAEPGPESSSFRTLRAKVSTLLAGLVPVKPKTSKAILRNDIVTPTEVADIDAIVRARRTKQFAEVPVPDELPIGTNLAFEDFRRAQTSGPCELLLLKGP